MLFITDAEFERVISRARNRALARKFYDQGSVLRVHVEETKNGYEIIGQVSVDGMIYTPRIEVNHNSKIISTECDCIYSDEYTSCAHTGALLLAVQELSPTRFPFDFKADYRQVREKRVKEQKKREEEAQRQREMRRRNALESASVGLTNAIRDEMVRAFEMTDPTPVKMQVILEIGYRYNLRFKVGRERFYFIKNIDHFIENINDRSYESYGKSFAWNHHMEDLDEPSQLIYDYLVLASKQGATDYYYTQQNLINLNGTLWDAFVKLMQQLPEGYSNIRYQTGHERPSIKVEADEYDFILKDETHYAFSYGFGKNNIYDKEANILYDTVLDQGGIAIKLLEELQQNDRRLYIAHEHMPDFYQYVIAPIKDYINFNDFDFSAFAKAEDKIVMYGDIDEDEVAYFNMLGVYGEEKINLITKPETPHSPHVDMIKGFLDSFNPDVDDKYYYFDTNHEETMDFLNKGIPFLASYADIYVSDALKKVGTKNKFNVSVGISVQNDLLSIDVDSIDIPKEELAAVLASYKKKKKYHKLKSGEMLYIESDELGELSEMMDRYHLATKDLKDGHIDMNLNRAFALEQDAEKMSHVTVKRSEAFEDVLNRLKDYKSHQYPLSAHYQKILRDYQKDGYQWLATMSDLHFGGILADDMGLGKTLQMVTLLENTKNNFSIIVTPSSLVLNWLDEFQKFSESISAVAVMGSASERKAIIKNAHHYNSLITSYDYMRRDVDLYKDYNFDFIILDEAQYIKNQKTKNAISVKKLKGIHRFALTGTPIENSLAELWSIFDFLNKDYLFNYTYFKKTYESPIVREHDEKKQAELKNLISPFVLRRTKSQVLKELPEKVEKTISIEFSSDEHKLYLAHLAAANKQLRSLDGKKDRIQILAMLTKLRQICCEPRMAFDNVKHISSKMQACLDIIENYKENGKKIIVFSSFKSALELIAQELDASQTKYHMLTGATNKLKRKEYVDAFQSDDSTVFLISLKAGGTGLNLTAAEGVIHFDPWWNMSAQSQATDRAHRIGQKNTVFVYKLIMADSIEEKIQKLQEAKKDLADTFVEGNDGRITSMTTEEIMDLFKSISHD